MHRIMLLSLFSTSFDHFHFHGFLKSKRMVILKSCLKWFIVLPIIEGGPIKTTIIQGRRERRCQHPSLGLPLSSLPLSNHVPPQVLIPNTYYLLYNYQSGINAYHIYTNLELLPNPVPPQDPLPIPFHAPQDQEAVVRILPKLCFTF